MYSMGYSMPSVSNGKYKNVSTEAKPNFNFATNKSSLMDIPSITKKLPQLPSIESDYENNCHFTKYANWIIPKRLMLGRYPYIEPSNANMCNDRKKGKEQLKKIMNTGIRTFVCLQDELIPQEMMRDSGMNGFKPYKPIVEDISLQLSLDKNISAVYNLNTDEKNVDFVYYPIVDLSIPTKVILDAILNDLENRIVNGENIYMHCWGGRGRAGLVACCLLSKLYNLSGEEVLERIGRGYKTRNKLCKKRSPETEEQIAFVRNFANNP